MNVFDRKQRARTLALLAVLIVGTMATGRADPEPQDRSTAERPHIVYFLADDLGWNDVGFHGSEIATPHLDSLAAAGVQLEQFYVQPFCSPTRSALMTGRYPIRYGLQTEVVRPWADHGLSTDERLLSEVLGEAGYFTSISGKWHLGSSEKKYLPRSRGFDHQYGHYIGALDYFTHRRMGALDWHRNGEVLREDGYTTNLIGDEVVRVIEEHDADQPMFLYVPFNAPHGPLQAPQEYVDRYAHIEDEDRRVYAGMVTCMDDAIGRIVDALGRRGMAENTLILFSSDNGGAPHAADNDPLRGQKGDVYEGGVRSPAFATWPGRLEAGTTVDEPVHLVDWYPTLARLADGSLDQPLPLDGKDIWPVLTEGASSPHDEILLNSNPFGGPGIAYPWAGLRRGDWKIVVDRGGRGEEVELYNLADDPYEETDLADERPDVLDRMRERLDFYEARAEPPLLSGPPPVESEVPEVWGPTD